MEVVLLRAKLSKKMAHGRNFLINSLIKCCLTEKDILISDNDTHYLIIGPILMELNAIAAIKK